jgi:hypothetical protein
MELSIGAGAPKDPGPFCAFCAHRLLISVKFLNLPRRNGACRLIRVTDHIAAPRSPFADRAKPD